MRLNIFFVFTSADVVEVVDVQRGVVVLGPAVVPGVELEERHLLLERGSLGVDNYKIIRL